MSVRFRPPPLAGFYAGEGADHATALIQAREEGFAEGRSVGLREGHASGLAEGAAQTRDAIRPELDALQESSAKRDRYDAVARALRHVREARAADLATVERSAREVATAALRTLFPVLLSHGVGAEIAALLADALTERAPETLTLRAHPDTLAAAAAETAEAAGDGRLVLAPDPTRDFGSVEIAWTGGGLTFDPAALLSQVNAALATPGPAPTIPPVVDASAELGPPAPILQSQAFPPIREELSQETATLPEPPAIVGPSQPDPLAPVAPEDLEDPPQSALSAIPQPSKAFT